MKPIEMDAVINRKRYSTKTATLIAGDDFWDGHNHERHGRNSFLYRTPKGSYFLLNRTCWQGERDSIEPIDDDYAYTLYETMEEKRVPLEEAFPGVMIEDA